MCRACCLVLLDFIFWTSSSAVAFPAVTHSTADRARCCLSLFLRMSSGCFTVFFDCLFLRRSSIQVPIRHCCCWTSSSAVSFTYGHPSHCRPSPVLLDVLLPFFDCQAVLFDPAWCSWNSSCCRVSSGHPFHCRSSSVLLDLFLRMSSGSALPFSSIVSSSGGHPSKCRPGTVLLDFIFGCLVYRRITHPTADRARCGLAFFFECLRDALPFSSIVSSSGRHPSMCRSGLVLLDFIFSCRVSSGHPSHC